MEENNVQPDSRKFHCKWHPPTYDEYEEVLSIIVFNEENGYSEEMIERINALQVGETYCPVENDGHADHSITRIE